VINRPPDARMQRIVGMVSADRPAKGLDKSCGKGYTQQDVIEVAKTLTGWTIDRSDEGRCTSSRSGGMSRARRRCWARRSRRTARRREDRQKQVLGSAKDDNCFDKGWHDLRYSFSASN
jgi:hypothetical protein